jgi:hypothetical protein
MPELINFSIFVRLSLVWYKFTALFGPDFLADGVMPEVIVAQKLVVELLICIVICIRSVLIVV